MRGWHFCSQIGIHLGVICKVSQSGQEELSGAKQSKAKQSKAKQSKAKQSKTKQSKAKPSQAKPS